jgi:hypothetical protein
LKKRARVDFCVEEKEEVFFIAPKSSQTRRGARCISYDYYIFIKEKTAVPFRTPPFAFSVLFSRCVVLCARTEEEEEQQHLGASFSVMICYVFPRAKNGKRV